MKKRVNKKPREVYDKIEQHLRVLRTEPNNRDIMLYMGHNCNIVGVKVYNVKANVFNYYFTISYTAHMDWFSNKFKKDGVISSTYRLKLRSRSITKDFKRAFFIAISDFEGHLIDSMSDSNFVGKSYNYKVLTLYNDIDRMIEDIGGIQ